MDSRTKLALKNIYASSVLRVFDVGIDLVLVPISLLVLSETEYGIWLLITSVIAWLNFYDFGIGHGLRNKLAQVLADGELEMAKGYISTAYIFISIISLFFIFFYLAFFSGLDLQSLFNTEEISNDILQFVFFIVIIGFSFRLVLGLINAVLYANQLPFYKDLIFTLSQLVILAGVYLGYKKFKIHFSDFAFLSTVVPLVVLLAANFFYYFIFRIRLKPSIRNFDLSKLKSIMGLGGKFFIIQLGVTMLFLTDNFIISYLYDPSQVTPYQISLKYFKLILVFFMVIISPFWSAVTEALVKNDFFWVKKSVRRLLNIWRLLIFGVFILFAVKSIVFKYWIGDAIIISNNLAIQSALFVVLMSLNSIYTNFINGTGKVYMQMISNLVTLLLNVPLSIFFARSLGPPGVLLATNVMLIFYIVLRKIQYQKIISSNARGIWNR